MPRKGAQREWTVQADEYGDLDREEVARRMLDVATVLCTIGGTIVAAPRRSEHPELDENGRPTGRTFWVNDELVIQWDSFAPGRAYRPEDHIEGGDIDEAEDDDAADIDPGAGALEEFEMRDGDEAAVDAELDEDRELEPTES